MGGVRRRIRVREGAIAQTIMMPDDDVDAFNTGVDVGLAVIILHKVRKPRRPGNSKLFYVTLHHR